MEPISWNMFCCMYMYIIKYIHLSEGSGIETPTKKIKCKLRIQSQKEYTRKKSQIVVLISFNLNPYFE